MAPVLHTPLRAGHISAIEKGRRDGNAAQATESSALQTADKLQNIGSKLGLLWQADLALLLAGGALGWLTGAVSRNKETGEKVSATVQKPLAFLRNTTLSDVAHKIRGTTPVEAVRVAQPVQQADGMVARFAAWRTGQLEQQVRKTAGKLVESNTMQARGVFQRAKGFAMGAAPVPVAPLGVAESVHGMALQLRGGVKDPMGSAQLLKRAMESITPEMAEGLAGEQAKRMATVTRHATALGNTLEKIPFWKSVQSGGLKGLMQALPKAAGRVSLFGAILGAAAVASSGAALMRAKGANEQTNRQLNELAADIYGVTPDKVTPDMIRGAQAPALLKMASSKVGAQARGEWAAAAGTAVSEGMILATMSSVGGVLAMFAPMGISMGADMLKSENPYLNSYTVLKEAAQGNGTLKPNQKVELTTLLLNAAPAMGEGHNRLKKPIAEQMVKEGLSPQQIVREMATPGAIEQRAVRVHEAMQAKAEAPKPEMAGMPVAANEHVPGKKIASIEPQGRMVQAGLAANR